MINFYGLYNDSLNVKRVEEDCPKNKKVRKQNGRVGAEKG